MAYKILGTVELIGNTESIPTKSGGTFNKRVIILKQRRFDQNTGQEFEPNFPKLEFVNNNTSKLDNFKAGDRVKIRYDINGTKSTDKNTGEVKYITSLRGFHIEYFVMPNQQPQAPQAAPPQNYPPQGGYPPQQPPYQGQAPYPPQQPAYPPQGQAPYAPQGQSQDPNSQLQF